MKRGLGVLAVAVVLMFLANSVLAADVVELTLWHHEAPAHRVKAIQDVINRFEEENPGVRIRQEVVSWDDAYGERFRSSKWHSSGPAVGHSRAQHRRLPGGRHPAADGRR